MQHPTIGANMDEILSVILACPADRLSVDWHKTQSTHSPTANGAASLYSHVTLGRAAARTTPEYSSNSTRSMLSGAAAHLYAAIPATAAGHTATMDSGVCRLYYPCSRMDYHHCKW